MHPALAPSLCMLGQLGGKPNTVRHGLREAKRPPDQIWASVPSDQRAKQYWGKPPAPPHWQHQLDEGL